MEQSPPTVCKPRNQGRRKSSPTPLRLPVSVLDRFSRRVCSGLCGVILLSGCALHDSSSPPVLLSDIGRVALDVALDTTGTFELGLTSRLDGRGRVEMEQRLRSAGVSVTCEGAGTLPARDTLELPQRAFAAAVQSTGPFAPRHAAKLNSTCRLGCCVECREA